MFRLLQSEQATFALLHRSTNTARGTCSVYSLHLQASPREVDSRGDILMDAFVPLGRSAVRISSEGLPKARRSSCPSGESPIWVEGRSGIPKSPTSLSQGLKATELEACIADINCILAAAGSSELPTGIIIYCEAGPSLPSIPSKVYSRKIVLLPVEKPCKDAHRWLEHANLSWAKFLLVYELKCFTYDPAKLWGWVVMIIVWSIRIYLSQLRLSRTRKIERRKPGFRVVYRFLQTADLKLEPPTGLRPTIPISHMHFCAATFAVLVVTMIFATASATESEHADCSFAQDAGSGTTGRSTSTSTASVVGPSPASHMTISPRR
ncbi:hypothetical protein C8R45DRAFT_942012 [Mycena sanguinolenta]|nr:hypothetical protein C8R45DRAFT_942012 [Mycena sanguinolenta]